MPVGPVLDAANSYLMPLAQQAATTVPSAVLPSYQQTVQAVTPYLPLAAQPGNSNEQSSYNQAAQHFKAGALPWVGDSGATQADTGLWYLTQALRNEQQLQRNWHSQQLRDQAASQVQLQTIQRKLDTLQASNEMLQRSVTAMAASERLHQRSRAANNLNVVG